MEIVSNTNVEGNYNQLAIDLFCIIIGGNTNVNGNYNLLHKMKEYKGHLLPSDLYYLLLSYCDRTEWEWYVSNGLGKFHGSVYVYIGELTDEQIDNLIQSAIKWNLE